MKVVFSRRAMTALLVETKEKITTETGGVFLGEFRDEICYVIETVDPGPKSIFTPTYFEYDVDYTNHLINKLSRIYQRQLDLVGLWHRHPGSLDRFSSTDDGTNSKYAQLSANGAISALVNIDPRFRLTVYHVTHPLSYEKVEYSVGDELIPKDILELQDITELENRLTNNGIKRSKGASSFADIFSNKAPDIYFGLMLHNNLKKRTMADIKSYNPRNFSGDLPLEVLLDMLSEDMSFMEEKGIAYNLEVTDGGLLKLCGIESKKVPWSIEFGMDGDIVVFVYNELTYKYKRGLFATMISNEIKR